VKTYAHWLFGVAGSVNLIVGLSLLLLPSRAAVFVGLEPAAGSHIVLIYFTGAMIAVFGYSYLRIAAEPARYRPLIHIGAIGKLSAFACAAVPWLQGQIGPRLPTLLTADVVFAALFLHYLWRTAKAPRA
jgi:hypothetical protein